MPIRAKAPTSKRSKAKDSRHHLFDKMQDKRIWHGPGAEMEGLKGEIKKEVWQNYTNGYSADGGEARVQNAGDPHRQAFWHVLIKPPKPVSTLYAALPDEMKDDLSACHKEAALSPIQYFQENAALTRRGGKGATNERAALIWGIFHHYESQSLDPELHTHAMLLNVCVRQDGTCGTVRTIDFFRELRAANAIYEATLAMLLRTKLGLTVTFLKKGGFEIEGVSQKLSEAFSKRGAAIREELQKRQTTNPKASRYAAQATRPDKEMLSREALFERWHATAKSFGFGEMEAKALIKPRHNDTKEHFDLNALFKAAVRDNGDKAPRNKLIDLGREMAIQGKATGEELKAAFQDNLPKKPGFVHVEWGAAFPKSPFWSPVHLIKTPRLVLGHPKQYRKWGDIVWEKKTSFGHVRVQKRIIASKAPKWSPFYKMTIPALRYGKMRVREWEAWGNTKGKIDLGVGELRLQQRKLFPRAMPWNPAKNIKVSLPRFVEKPQTVKGEPPIIEQQH